ncbi:TonB-dependent receptor [Pontibacter cellulosilyticus]|uniref:TonB-dependent receptor n=1 Tax=Pontibacter cellulosilyticus TaxID=1720253 RepID=A0A923SKP1_9BACT|nr:TonB-dependent receptor [Pontibacter cellulosilyticus]MBC5994957.1 TonB-dependent receptor [Pontibacter cellulosilyticus]
MKKISTSITIFFCLVPLLVLAQKQYTITGQVLDTKGQPVIGANVFIKDSYDGTSSGTDGSFTFTTAATGAQTVAASSLGYESQEQSINISATGEAKVYFKLKEKLSQLTAVTITAGAFEAGDEKRSTILSSLDIATTAGATADIYGAINTLPGAQRVGEEGKLFVRGGDSYETKTFIDGLLVQKPYNSSVPDLPARGRFSPFMFSGTTFSSGGYSAEYGQALSSALLLKTNGLPEKTETGISIMSVGVGASHTQRWENTSLALTADYSNMAPYVGLVKQNIDWKRAPESKGGSIVLRHKTSETGMLKAYSSYAGSRLALSQATPEGTANAVALDNRNFFSNITYQDLLTEKWTLHTGISYMHNADDIKVDEQNIAEQDNTVQAKATLEHQLADPLWLKFGSELTLRRYEQQYQQNANAQSITSDFDETLTATFAEADWYLSNNLVARAGVRAEYSALLEKANIAPRLSLAYKTDEHGQISAAFGQFYQLPEAQFLKINDELTYENATHYILNYQRQQDKRTFRAEVYYKKYNHLTKYNPELPRLPVSYSNSGSGYAQGIDLFWRDRKSIKNGDYWISYSLLDTRRNYRDYPQQAIPAFASKHNLALVYKHFVPDMKTQFGATYSFASGRPYNDPNQDGFNQSRTPNYNDLSLNVSYLTNIRGNFTVLYLSATNLLGSNQVFGYRYTSNPDETGTYNSMQVGPPAKRFLFAGLFINFGGQSIHH